MTVRALIIAGLTAALWGTFHPAAAASDDHDGKHDVPVGLLRAVRQATQDFKNVNVAMAAGYGSLGSCVTGPERGAMGVHFGKPELIGDGLLDANTPELLIFEPKDGRMRLVGVEFLVIADAWHASNPDAPPVLMGQHFNYVASPNRYGLPAFYELHVWAWRDNRFGVFVDWNPDVSCAEFDPQP